MIEIIKGLPDKVIGIVARGPVTDHDRDRVLLPVLKKKIPWHTHPRLYFELKSGDPGPLWDDLTEGLQPLPRWERVAVVTDTASVRYSVMMLRLIVPGQMWAFEASQAREALAWITADLPPEFAPTLLRAGETPRRKWVVHHGVRGKPPPLVTANDVL